MLSSKVSVYVFNGVSVLRWWGDVIKQCGIVGSRCVFLWSGSRWMTCDLVTWVRCVAGSAVELSSDHVKVFLYWQYFGFCMQMVLVCSFNTTCNCSERFILCGLKLVYVVVGYSWCPGGGRVV